MLEISCIVPSGSKYRPYAAAVHILHCFAEQIGIVAVIDDVVLAERVGACNSRKLPRYQRVRSAGRDTQIIFENVPLAVLALHKIDPGNVAVYLVFRGYALALCEVAR